MGTECGDERKEDAVSRTQLCATRSNAWMQGWIKTEKKPKDFVTKKRQELSAKSAVSPRERK